MVLTLRLAPPSTKIHGRRCMSVASKPQQDPSTSPPPIPEGFTDPDKYDASITVHTASFEPLRRRLHRRQAPGPLHRLNVGSSAEA